MVQVKDEGMKGDSKYGATRWREILNTSFVGITLAALVILFSILSPYFFTSLNWTHVFQQVSVVAILTIGQTFVIISAGIDLSQGSVIGMTGMISALLMSSNVPMWVAIIAGLGVGVIVGAINGLLIIYGRIPPFIATLATMSMGAGGALLLTGGEPIFGLPQVYSNFGQGVIGIFPYIFLVAFVLAIVFHVVLSKTRFGRFTYAVGSNAAAARLSGLRVKKQVFWVYVLSGFLSAVGGLLMTAWVNTALPTSGNNYELDAIAAVVIGGGSLFGGEGTMQGSMIGALLMAVLANGVELLGVSSYTQEVLLGLVLVVAVYVDQFRRKSPV